MKKSNEKNSKSNEVLPFHIILDAFDVGLEAATTVERSRATVQYTAASKASSGITYIYYHSNFISRNFR